MLLNSDGTLWMWGRNNGFGAGALGQNSTTITVHHLFKFLGSGTRCYMYDQRLIVICIMVMEFRINI